VQLSGCIETHTFRWSSCTWNAQSEVVIPALLFILGFQRTMCGPCTEGYTPWKSPKHVLWQCSQPQLHGSRPNPECKHSNTFHEGLLWLNRFKRFLFAARPLPVVDSTATLHPGACSTACQRIENTHTITVSPYQIMAGAGWCYLAAGLSAIGQTLQKWTVRLGHSSGRNFPQDALRQPGVYHCCLCMHLC
jgi:hypothetical protein